MTKFNPIKVEANCYVFPELQYLRHVVYLHVYYIQCYTATDVGNHYF